MECEYRSEPIEIYSCIISVVRSIIYSSLERLLLRFVLDSSLLCHAPSCSENTIIALKFIKSAPKHEETALDQIKSPERRRYPLPESTSSESSDRHGKLRRCVRFLHISTSSDR
jgi:hypothetical protein